MIRSVTIAKGIGIILVVIGHYYPDESPAYWDLLHSTIYNFHMPLFLILSGYLHAKLSPNQKLNIQYVKKKFYRLMVPFFSIALIAFIIKYFAGFFFDLEHPVSAKSFLFIFITKERIYFPLLWFVYSLFIIFIIFPILETTIRSKPLVFLISLLLMLIKWPPDFYLNDVFRSLPFFSFGALFLKKIDLDELRIKEAFYVGALGFFVFIIASIFLESFNKKSLYIAPMHLISGISGSMTIICIAAVIIKNNASKLNKTLYLVGFYSMSIYLLHTLFSSPIRIINYQIFKSNAFILPALAAIFAGLIFPLLLEVWVLRKNRFTRKYILGVS